jgi:hypothetical protein
MPLFLRHFRRRTVGHGFELGTQLGPELLDNIRSPTPGREQNRGQGVCVTEAPGEWPHL